MRRVRGTEYGVRSGAGRSQDMDGASTDDYFERRTANSVLRTPYPVLRTPYSVLGTAVAIALRLNQTVPDFLGVFHEYR